MNHLFKRYYISLQKLAIIGVFIIACLTLIMSNISIAEDVDFSDNGRLMTIYDRGSEKVIVSSAKTVGDVLKQAGISVDSRDAVEPSINTELVASDYQINIYRARPVIIIDGNVKLKIFTPYQTAEQIAKDAGLIIFNEDNVNLGLSNDLNDGAGLKLEIIRAKSFTFTLYGKTNQVRTQASTVEVMLNEKGINLNSADKISVDLQSEIIEGMSIRLWREGKETITIEEDIEFDVDEIEDVDQSVGYSLIKSAGVTGARNVTYEVVIENDIEVSRTEIASITIKHPVSQIEVIGVKGQYTTPSENENITWDYLISQGFSRVQTAGIMGNLMQEHRFNTSGDGIAQWINGRRDNLYSRPYPNNIYTQLDFLMEELNGSYAYVRDEIKATDSIKTATQIFQNKFERCGFCREDLRLQYASDILASH